MTSPKFPVISPLSPLPNFGTMVDENIVSSSLLHSDYEGHTADKDVGAPSSPQSAPLSSHTASTSVPPPSIWSNRDDDDRVTLLRMPPPMVENDGPCDNGFSNEEKTLSHSNGAMGSNGNYYLNRHSRRPQHSEFNGSSSNHHQNPLSNVGSKASNNPFNLSQSLLTTSLLMKKLGHILAVSSSAIFLLLVFPLLLNSAINDARQGKTDFAAFYSAAGFVVITLVLSFREILSHLYNWYAPDVQKFVVRILFMVPLYSVQSWLSLRFHGPARVYIDTIRDLYEAYVIQSFVYYLIELLGGEDRMAELLSRKEASLGGHGWFMTKAFRMERWQMGKDFLLKVKHGVLQYVVVKTILTLLTTFVLLPSGLYGEGTFSWNYAYGYIAVLLNISVLYALYCLVKLFHAVKSDLRSPVNWRPVGKFLCVKGVVFFTWWQGVGIYFLRSHGFIGDIGTWSGDDVANGIIDYLVCVEMVFFSIAHMFTFTYREYLPDGMEDKIRAGLIGVLFSKIDKARRSNNTMSGSRMNKSQESEQLSALLGDDEDDDVTPCIDENGEVTEGSYRPPASSSAMRTLDAPLSLREALWSSTVPSETLDDIKRLGVVSGQGSFGRGRGVIGGSAIDISLTNMHNAESI